MVPKSVHRGRPQAEVVQPAPAAHRRLPGRFGVPVDLEDVELAVRPDLDQGQPHPGRRSGTPNTSASKTSMKNAMNASVSAVRHRHVVEPAGQHGGHSAARDQRRRSVSREAEERPRPCPRRHDGGELRTGVFDHGFCRARPGPWRQFAIRFIACLRQGRGGDRLGPGHGARTVGRIQRFGREQPVALPQPDGLDHRRRLRRQGVPDRVRVVAQRVEQRRDLRPQGGVENLDEQPRAVRRAAPRGRRPAHRPRWTRCRS